MMKDTEGTLKVVPFKKSDDSEMFEVIKGLFGKDSVICLVAAPPEGGLHIVSNAKNSVAASMFSYASDYSRELFIEELTNA